MIETVLYDPGARIAHYRKRMKISAEELADRAGAGLTRSIIANLENGRKDDLSVKQLIAIAYQLGISPTELIFDLKDPYAKIALVDNPGQLIEAATYLARGWFGGARNALELNATVNGESAPPPGSDSEAWLISHDCDERVATLYALTAHEERLEDLHRNVENPRHASLGENREYLEKRIREFRADMYEIDRRLRTYGVNIDRLPIFPGSPF